jgi:predicted acyl esterase
MGPGITFESAPFESEIEITGPVAASLRVATTAPDCDLFLTLHVIDPEGRRLSFRGAIDPHTPLTQGWLRLTHRALDAELSEPYRPVHSHLGPEPVVAGQAYDVEVELWPTSVVVPAGHRLALNVAGQDFADDDLPSITLAQFKNEMRGCGPFLHDDPIDRDEAVFGGTTTLHAGPDSPANLLLPVIPKE